MDDRQLAVTGEYPPCFLQKRKTLIGVEDVEQHDVIHSTIGQPGTFDRKISLT